MPRSKRDKKVSLTKTKAKGLQHKQTLIKEIRAAIDGYKRIFVFSVNDMRNSYLKDIRQDWKSSRFFFGKNKLMCVAMGKSASDEYAENLSSLTATLKGQMGLLFTNKSKDKVIKYFRTRTVEEFSRTGNRATRTVTISIGPVPQFSHALEPHLRQLGLPTELRKGIIHITAEFVICSKGSNLTANQAQILKLFGVKLATFHISVLASWVKDGSQFEQFKERKRKSSPQDTSPLILKGEDIENASMDLEDDNNIVEAGADSSEYSQGRRKTSADGSDDDLEKDDSDDDDSVDE